MALKNLFKILVFLLMCPACSQANVTATTQPTRISVSDTPLPPITSVMLDYGILVLNLSTEARGYILTWEKVCLYIREDAFGSWKSFWDDRADISPVEITLNDEKVTQVWRFATHDHLIPDPKEEDLQITWSSFEYCFKPAESGLQEMSIRITDTSGKVHSYNMEFYVNS